MACYNQVMEIKSEVTKLRRWSHAHTFVTGTIFGLLGLLAIGLGVTLGLDRDRSLLPGIRIAGLGVGQLSGESAAFLLSQKIGSQPIQFLLTSDKRNWQVSDDLLKPDYDLPATINQAWLVGRQGGLLNRLTQIGAAIKGETDLPLVVKIDDGAMDSLTASIAAQLDDPAIQPALRVTGSGDQQKVVLEPGKDGLAVNQARLASEINLKFSRLEFAPLPIPIEEIKVTLDSQQAKQAVALGELLLNHQLTVKAPDTDDWVLDAKDLISLVSLAKSEFDPELLAAAIADFGLGVNRVPQNAAFRFTNGRVEEFRPGKDGLQLDQDKLLAQINQNFNRLQHESVTLEAPVVKTTPQITTESVNSMGIKEQLGLGDSTYHHSIANRIFNIGLTASKINGVVIPPGATFSFNDTVGDISAATGYKSAYVIKEGRTVLGDGGGVCQVSTTLFRAALAAGLPIVERKAHAYRVGYYEQNSPAGIDATVYGPTVDLKFKNNTPAYLLIQTENDPQTEELKISIYGSDDGRKVAISTPVIWGQSPPPPPLYQDDSGLAPGETKQVDWAAWGAKTRFDYKVTRGDEVLEERTFYSTYQPWQAVYLRGPSTISQTQ